MRTAWSIDWAGNGLAYWSRSSLQLTANWTELMHSAVQFDLIFIRCAALAISCGASLDHELSCLTAQNSLYGRSVEGTDAKNRRRTDPSCAGAVFNTSNKPNCGEFSVCRQYKDRPCPHVSGYQQANDTFTPWKRLRCSGNAAHIGAQWVCMQRNK